MRPSSLLTGLTFAAAIVGAQLHTEHALRHLSPDQSGRADATLQLQLKQLTSDNEQLQRDNASLRALLSAEAPVAISADLISFVENDLDLQFTTPPLALLANEDQLNDAAGQIWLAAFSEGGLEMRSYAFEKLGILPPNQNFMGQIITAQTMGAIGIYDHSSSEILLKTDFDSENIHHQAALIRLLAIALLENAHPLPHSLSDDSFHVRQALHGGRAAQLQERFYSLQARHIGFVDPAESNNTEALEVFISLSPYVRAITTFPNTYGKDYLAQLPSKLAVSEAVKNSELTTLAIAQNRAPSPQKPDAALQLDTQLGALTVRSFLSQLDLLDQPDQDTVTAHLRTDRLTIEIKDGQPLTQWKLDWDSVANAEVFFQRAQSILSAMESPPLLSQNGTRVILTVTDLSSDHE